MKADPKRLLTGNHFLNGNHSATEGAIAAGCTFAAGYPITPSTEIVERIASRFPRVGGCFIQMEDEIASSICLQGAVWSGRKSMTVTSGPGFSLMMEHIGLAAITETPCVFINVQRCGPSTGLPTKVGQADMMQAKYGSHGDYEVIALAPSSPQDCFDFTIDCFNLSEEYRTPVFLMADEMVGHMVEKVVIPEASEIDLVERKYYSGSEKYLPYKPEANGIPLMSKAGLGHNYHITGLTHDERGYPVLTKPVQEKMMERLMGKIQNDADKLMRVEEYMLDDADIVLVSYGISHRMAYRAMEMAREKGIKVGLLRLITCWPFPEKKIKELAQKVNSMIMVELNYGQMFIEMDRFANAHCTTDLCGSSCGDVHEPEEIFNKILEAAKQ
ncbi:MAG: 2-oxoacid:acceptor oxidoreductase subunit alpha [Proteobacteria bacterium]|nr:2-oxoacid:acceptor oxidoreductase subunit alpha [Pseudomonadota bacterium]